MKEKTHLIMDYCVACGITIASEMRKICNSVTAPVIFLNVEEA